MSETSEAPVASLLGSAPPAPAPAAAAPAEAAAPAVAGREWLPEAFRSDPAFKDLGSVEALAKTYKSAVSMVGLDKAAVLRVPKDEADAGAWDEVFAKLGRPEAPDKYGFKAEGLPEPLTQAAREAFHKAGLNDRQAGAVMALYQEQQQAQLAQAQQAMAATMQQTEQALRGEWGQAYDQRLAAAKTAVREVGGPEVIQVLNDTGLGNHPAVIQMFAKLGAERAEAPALKGVGNAAGGPLTPDQARAEIGSFMGTPDAKALMDRDHPGYPAAKAKWDALHRAAFGAAA